MKVYDERKVLEEVVKLINYDYKRVDLGPWKVKAEFDTERIWRPHYDADEEEKKRFKFAQLLLSKYNSKKDITLSPNEIEHFLIDRRRKVLYPSILLTLNSLEADMEGVCLDGLYLLGYDFSKLKNLKIDLDKVECKYLIHTKFNEAHFTGSFDGCRIFETIFENCTAEQALDPQTISDRVLVNSKFGGIEIKGSLNNINICGADFSESKGQIIINPQEYHCTGHKCIENVSFNNCYVFGNYNEETKRYEQADFSGVSMCEVSFKGVKNQPTIDVGKLDNCSIIDTELVGVKLIGTAKSKDIFLECTIDGKDFNLNDPTTYEGNELVQIKIAEEPPKVKQKGQFFKKLKEFLTKEI